MSASLSGENHPRLSFRHGKVPAEVVVGFTIGVLTFAIMLAWALQARAGRLDMTADAVLEPIPADQVPEDGGCCGGDPQEGVVCAICFTYAIAGLGEFTVCDSATCRGRRNVCYIRSLEQLPNGHYVIDVECQDLRNIQTRKII